MRSAAGSLSDGLAALDRAALRRRRRVLDSAQAVRVAIGGREFANFSSNDYLGLAADPRLKAAAIDAITSWGVGAGASALVSGHMRIHDDAERRFARFCGMQRALLFASGYAANLGVLAAFCDRESEIFADRLDHACLVDGAILSRARLTRYRHLDLAALEARLAASKASNKLVATDTVFSMDGDLAPVPALLELCERHDAWLLLDDAHGVGVIGGGHGALEHFGIRSDRILYMATLGKALGGYGAFVAASPDAIDWLLQRARTYIFSTALPPMAAASAIAAMEIVDTEPGLIHALHHRIAHFRSRADAARLPLLPSGTAIQPVVLGDSQRALDASQALIGDGFFVPAIRPPTVPHGSARLRVSLCATHDLPQIDALVQALSKAIGA
ncbi:MAG TPA: 8-amino-7-oxononanoate synthase [Usitatibacter sp.]|nr:8-amino-7-oxononanoate synthase [Usitatibacter sp.]